MIQGIGEKLNYFELRDKVGQKGWNIPTSTYIDNHIDNIPFNRVWVSDPLNNEYIDMRHYVYDKTTKQLIQTNNLELIDCVVLIDEEEV